MKKFYEFIYGQITMLVIVTVILTIYGKINFANLFGIMFALILICLVYVVIRIFAITHRKVSLLDVEEYKVIQKLNDKNNNLCDILNDNGMANMTICPICFVDDFAHIKNCKLG